MAAARDRRHRNHLRRRSRRVRHGAAGDALAVVRMTAGCAARARWPSQNAARLSVSLRVPAATAHPRELLVGARKSSPRGAPTRARTATWSPSGRCECACSGTATKWVRLALTSGLSDAPPKRRTQPSKNAFFDRSRNCCAALEKCRGSAVWAEAAFARDRDRPGSSSWRPGPKRALAQHAGRDGAADLVDDRADLGGVAAQAGVGAGPALEFELPFEG